MPSKKFTGVNRNGDPIVIAWPMPDCGLSGATTIIFPRSFTASTRFLIPGADTPSSLVIRITGFSFFLAAVLFFTVAFAGFLVFDIGSYSKQKCFVFSVIKNVFWKTKKISILQLTQLVSYEYCQSKSEIPA